jgi:AGCS family alanine or glycine:cation symporter
VLLFLVVKRIAKFTEFIVPNMAIGYILIVLVIIAIDFDQLPGVIALVFKSAFNMEAGFGAVFGLAIQWGVKRGIYSNEAGQGTAPYCGSCKCFTSYKTRFSAVFSVYIDTLLVCSATGFMFNTGKYNVQNPNFGTDGASEFFV